MGRDDEGPPILATLREHGTTVPQAVLAAVDGFDAEDMLLASGVSAPDLQAVRSRLVSVSEEG
jgi:hypothetical protein